ncbi:transposase [Massilia eurypsychrophila]|jgi:putative transposase|uniref:Transposase n=1 Tax=Massilia eurypsychrophila TaxID=1485217 RepID=A0A2G8TKD0_9BURK|nr:transposase [Massilia eurypsychrophila]PIL46497.1 transposase [Massilia eurypsychrophila]
MPRQPRPVAADVPLHITQRGNNRLRCFFEDDDYRVYLYLLRAASLQAECRIHAYVLMSNHVHLLVSPKDELGPALMMKSLGQRYVQYVNRRYARTGTLWEGRYHSCLVHSETYLMVCQRYIELNPVRAGLVAAPALYAWSSYHHNAHGPSSKLVVQHELYGRLGQDTASRQSAYRALFDELIDPEIFRRVRKATRGNTALGAFGSEQPYSLLMGRLAAPNPVGRPRKG